MVDQSPQLPPDTLTQRELEFLQLMGQGLSNRDIAHELVISLQTARWYCKQIYSKLGVHSREQAMFRANEMGLLAASGQTNEMLPDGLAHTAVKHNLPLKVTSFVGRASDVTAISEMIVSSRFVTLTGPPGTGKTRLALEVASELTGIFEQGVCFVELAPVSDPGVVAEAIANALTLQEAGQIAIENVLKIYLREKHILLVLDNFEQVIDAAPLIGELLSVAQTLHVMVTSRQALQIYGEHEFVVQPLSLPDLESQSLLDDLAKSEACTLFVQRARAAKSNFEVTDENAAAIAKICVKLDGLPLAIELAAAQIKIFSPQTMLPRLEDSLNVLKTELRDLPKRHASLNQAISWSYNLLSETEQRLLARLSVFIAGRSIEAAEVVCGEKLNIDVLDGLSSLLNKGLLRLEEDRTGEPRFFMLETIHAYARERLQERGEVDHMQRLHAEFFTDWVEYAEPYTAAGGRQLYWLHRLETEHDNLRAALTWSFDGGDYEIGQRMVGALAHFWERRGHHREWKEWLARAWVGIEEVPKPIRASLVQSAGYLAYNRHEYPEAIQHLKKAERLFRELDDKNKCALMKIKHSVLLAARPEAYQEAIQLIETAFALLRETGNEPLYCQGLNALGNVEHRNGNFEDARKIFEETLALARGIGDQLRECLMQENLGDVHCHIGNYDQAELFIKESLKVGKEIDFKYVVADSLRIFSGISAGRGEVKRAAQLLGATVAAFEEIGIRLQPQDQPEFDRQVANIHDKLGTETFDDMWARGRAMTLDNALEFAIANSSAE